MNGSDGDAATKKMLLSLSARVKSLEAAVAQLQEPAIDRAHRGLAELADRIDARTPGKVPSNAVAGSAAFDGRGMTQKETAPREMMPGRGRYWRLI